MSLLGVDLQLLVAHAITEEQPLVAYSRNRRTEETMNQDSFTTVFTVDRSPDEAFTAINDVRGWWSGDIEGDTANLGAEFTYRYQDIHYSKQQITESVSGQKVVWHVLDASLSFVEDKTEWTGTDIVFEIVKKGDQTEVRFTHVGLGPDAECFDSCSSAWGSIINTSLRDLIETGAGDPIR
jgi:hypothetical protein